MTPPPHHDGRGYRNPWPGSEPQGLANLLRWFYERHTSRLPPDPHPSVFPLEQPRLGQVPGAGALAATWMGHSAVLLEFPGCTVITDPMLGDVAAPVPAGRLKRWVPVPIPVESLPRIDIVLLSHNHYDHLDAPTVRALASRQRDTVWCVPLGLGRLLRRLGVRRVEEFDWWESREVGPARVTATPAQHFSARGVHDRNATLWCGFSIRVGERAAFFAGDTAHHPEFADIGSRLGPFDLLLLPVGAYQPRWFMRVVHMDPAEALGAYAELAGDGAPALLPIHWGTFKLTDEPMDEPPRVTQQLWQEAGRAGERLWLLRHGETRVLR